MKKNLKLIFLGTMIFFLTIYSLQNILITFRQVFRNVRYIATHSNDTYDDKMRIYWWTVYDYLQFVKNNTPPDSTIVIPPQERPWLTSGNPGIVNYFLYPRKLLSGSLNALPSDHFDYVMIVRGEWADAPTEKYGWPKVPVKADEIIYFDQQTKNSQIVKGNFDPADLLTKQTNGLIKVGGEK